MYFLAKQKNRPTVGSTRDSLIRNPLSSVCHSLKPLFSSLNIWGQETYPKHSFSLALCGNKTTAKSALLAEPHKQGDSLLLHLSVASALTVSLFVLIIGASLKDMPRVSVQNFDLFSRDYQGVSLSALSPLEQQVHHTNTRAKQEVAGKIHFLTQYIENFSPRITHATAKRIALDIYTESHRAGVDPFFIASLIESESSFRSKARSSRSAYGLMQVQPTTARYTAKKMNTAWKGSHSLLAEQRYNLKIGIAYLKYLETRFNGDTKKALMAYNWGPTNLGTALKRKKAIPKSVRAYAQTIVERHRMFSQKYENSKSTYAYMNVNFIPQTLWADLIQAHSEQSLTS